MRGRNVLVVGASSGIGLAFANTARFEGANVVGVARREKLLWDQKFYPITADVTESESMEKMAAEAAAHFDGPIDLMLYSVGLPGTMEMNDIELDTMGFWQEMYATNTVGANLATAAILPHLNPDGMVAFLSSKSVEEELPLIGAYTSSKAALDQSIKTWRREHPEHRFCRVVLSWTAPTDAMDHMGSKLKDAFGMWKHIGIPGGTIDTHELAEALVGQFSVALNYPKMDFTELQIDTRFDGKSFDWWDMMEDLMP
tara:strand:- start:237 stop:1004 length:768 start_codon:yes stop_codon:yes gene_type:complete